MQEIIEQNYSTKFQRVWLYIIALASFFFTAGQAEGVSAVDVVFGIGFVGSLFIWFFYEILIKKHRIVYNIADWLFIFFFIMAIIYSAIALLNDVTFLDWVREYAIYFVLLYYFPIRHNFKDKKHLTIFLICLGIAVVSCDLKQIFDYKSVALSVASEFAYELGRTIRSNISIYTAAFLFGLVFSLHVKKYYMRILCFMFSALSLAALVVTFSRTYWVIALLIVFFAFIYLPLKQKIRLVVLVSIIAVLLIGFATLVYKENSKIAFKVIENRFLSSGKGKKDKALNARFVEYQTVYKKIAELPLGGQGFNKKYSYIFFLTKISTHSSYVHNGYLYLTYRVGIPLSICFYFAILYYFIKSERLARKTKDPFYKIIAVDASSILIMLTIANFGHDAFFCRDGVWMFAIGVGFLGICETNRNKELQNENQ